MLILIIICNVISTYGFVLPTAYNLLLKDNTNYQVDLVINEDDYEMVDTNQLKDFIVDNKEFEDFDKLAGIEYKKNNERTYNVNVYNIAMKTSRSSGTETTTIMMNVTVDKEDTSTYIGHLSTHANKKKDLEKENEMKIELEYNYNELLNEYYDEANNEAVAQTSVTEIQDYGIKNAFKRLFLSQNESNNICNKSAGLQAIKCLVRDLKRQGHVTRDTALVVWRTAQVWFLVYLIVAVPMWCTRGWCCCCLFCKFSKPRQSIEEAKRYLISNPPGLYKTKSGEVQYAPTEQEKETYEEFDHFMKTL